LKAIRALFTNKYPRSVKTVEGIVTTLTQKTSRSLFSHHNSPTKQASVLLSIEVNLESMVEVIDSAWLYE
jgi:acetyl esterase/lipase